MCNLADIGMRLRNLRRRGVDRFSQTFQRIDPKEPEGRSLRTAARGRVPITVLHESIMENPDMLHPVLISNQ